MLIRFHPPPAAPGSTVQLVLPRKLLDQHVQRRPQPAAKPGAAYPGTLLGHGPLRLQPLGQDTLALVPRLAEGPPQRLPAGAGQWPGARPGARLAATTDLPAGLMLLYQAAPGETCPTAPAAWETWLACNAPEFRLATTALVPDVAVLWLRADGQAQACLRTGDAWAALHGPAAARASWRPVEHLALPGPLMLDSRRDGGTPPAATTQQPLATEPAPLRHSRLAAALGTPVLQRLQRSLWVVVGCDTTGSMLAHSLARMGVNLLVLDPAAMVAHSLDADLPPLQEGRAKPVALQHLLRGVLRPGARCDARALSVASPAAGSLLAAADGLLCCTADADARHWANAWALALLKPLLAVRTTASTAGFQADLQLLPPGGGCLACSEGDGTRAANAPNSAPASTPGMSATPRSWQGVAAHATLRLLEQLYEGRVAGPLQRQLVDALDGSLQVQDRPLAATARLHCPACQHLLGAGLQAVQPVLHGFTARLAA